MGWARSLPLAQRPLRNPGGAGTVGPSSRGAGARAPSPLRPAPAIGGKFRAAPRLAGAPQAPPPSRPAPRRPRAPGLRGGRSGRGHGGFAGAGRPARRAAPAAARTRAPPGQRWWEPRLPGRRPPRHGVPGPGAALRAVLRPPGPGRPRRLLRGALQLEGQATLHRDISRRVAAFRFELREDGRPELPPQAHGLGVDGACRPCSDAELLLAACTSDFVIHGIIHGVAHDVDLQESVITVMAARVLRQTPPLFGRRGSGEQGLMSIRTPLRCGVRPGPGTFLFMGWSRFGEAWLGCAPRLQEFRRAYEAARAAHLHPCEVALH
ncbi:meteorin isoform X2 [Trachypithecus francoisi]|uniref:meteorin isoform X2 n=1 Tax=Trachypithecus francoisi TaxID=54180 RepID=UPI00141A7042|nr:meteorin isoform X2 [Trachypithecus francoisi]